jgi:hypothetical protein
MSGKRYAIRYRNHDDLRMTAWMAEHFNYDDTLAFLHKRFSRPDEAEIISVDTDGTEQVERTAAKQPQD